MLLVGDTERVGLSLRLSVADGEVDVVNEYEIVRDSSPVGVGVNVTSLVNERVNEMEGETDPIDGVKSRVGDTDQVGVMDRDGDSVDVTVGENVTESLRESANVCVGVCGGVRILVSEGVNVALILGSSSVIDAVTLSDVVDVVLEETVTVGVPVTLSDGDALSEGVKETDRVRDTSLEEDREIVSVGDEDMVTE